MSDNPEDNAIAANRLWRQLFQGVEQRQRAGQKGEAFAGLDLPRRSSCEHQWVTTDNWLIDRCTKCGEERA